MSDRLTRIAIVSSDRCKPKKCRQECKKSCPVVKTGELVSPSLCVSLSLYVVVIWSLKFDVFPCLALRLYIPSWRGGFWYFSGTRLQGSFVLRCPRSPRLPLFPRSFASVVVFVWRSVKCFRECFNCRIRASPSLGLLCWLNSNQHFVMLSTSEEAWARVNGASSSESQYCTIFSKKLVVIIWICSVCWRDCLYHLRIM